MTQFALVTSLVILFAVIFVLVVRLRPQWLPRGLVQWHKHCPACGKFALAEVAGRSWTVSEAGELMLLSWGAAREPGEGVRARMKERWPEEASEKYLQCGRCMRRFVRTESHPMAGAPVERIEPCSEERWQGVVAAR